jgi:hypothetical protein
MPNSSSYYAQVDSSNKVMIKIIKNNEDYSRICHDVLSRALCMHRISRYGATKVTPYELVHGQDVVYL